MEDSFIRKFNDTLSTSYVLYNRIEQIMFNSSKRFNLSVSELTMLEVINKSPVTGKMIGDIAHCLMITPSSVTIAVNRLEKKGYVARHRSATDGRQVYVNLTEKGRHADRIHKRFRKNMAKDIVRDMTLEEKNILLKCIERMNNFLLRKIAKSSFEKDGLTHSA
ncbi:MAG: MarR family transcriptional regulator [Acutalibacteraceae bacterium]|nr:MarR family transcriptional regulator [Acutalibacteraceae bacterium]